MLWVLLVLQLSRAAKEAPVAAPHFAQQIQNPGAEGVVLGLEVSPEGAHQIPHDLLHGWFQELRIETAHTRAHQSRFLMLFHGTIVFPGIRGKRQPKGAKLAASGSS